MVTPAMNAPPLEISCPCGKTKIRATVDPIGAGICHCNECRYLTQGIANEGVLFPTGTLECTQGTILSKKRPDMEMTCHCCGDEEGCGIIMYHTEKHGLDVVATSEVRRCYGEIPENFKSQAHHWYKEKIYKIDDDLPKFLDGPKAFGLSGIMVDSDGNPIEESTEKAE
jgi:hypothetical protein